MIRLQNFLKMSSRRICETSWRLFEDVLKTSWRCLEDVLKTYGQDEYIVLDQDVFWRHMINKNIFVFIKTSWRRLLKMKTKDVFKTASRRVHQDECLRGRHQKGVSDVLLMFLFSTLSRFHKLFWCFCCWLWTSKYWPRLSL